MSDAERDPIIAALAEVKVMRKVLDILEPLTAVERCRTMAAVCAHFGLYDQAISALQAAQQLSETR